MNHMVATITKILQTIMGKKYAIQTAEKYRIKEILPYNFLP